MQNKNEVEVKRRFPNDVANHEITVLHSDGLYRHYRCQKPGTRVMGFDIVTWPGFLAMTGDMGEFVFSRTADMISFMRGAAMSYSYAAEKCVAAKGELKEFSEELFREVIDERRQEVQDLDDSPTKSRTSLDDMLHSWSFSGPSEKQQALDHLDEIVEAYETYQDPHDAYRAMYESQLWDCDLPSCKEYTYHFLWALHAIKWFCDRVESEVASAD